MSRTVNQNAIGLIKSFEGLYNNAYRCPAGVLTIGYGHTGEDVHEGQHISDEQADDLLDKDLAIFATGVEKLVTAPLNDNQFGALVSFAFNLGLGALSGSSLLRLLNAGAYGSAALQFLRWDHCNGKVLAGLTRRRAAEKALFLREPDSA